MKNSEMGNRIASRRKALHLSQSQLAELTGYSDKTAISKIENGQSQLNQTKIVLFADALRTTPAYLMGWVDDPNLSKEEIFEKERSERLSAYANALTAQAHKATHGNSPPPESLQIALAYDNAPQHIKDAIKALLQIKEE